MRAISMLPLHLSMVIPLGLMSVFITSVQGEGCTVCRDGSSIGIPDQLLRLQPLFNDGPVTCLEVSERLPTMLNSTDGDCLVIQSFSSICGCPSEANSCTICPGGGTMHAPEKVLMIDTLHSNPITSNVAANVTLVMRHPTCGIMDAYMRTSVKQDSVDCNTIQAFWPEYCQCAGTNTVGLLDDDGHDELEDDATNQPQPCSFCEDGSPVALPDEVLGISDFAESTCKDIEQGVALLFEDGSKFCNDTHEMSTVCGCPRKANSCSLCPDGSSITEPNTPVDFLSEHMVGFQATCKLLQAYTHSFDSDSDTCAMLQTASSLCGCEATATKPCKIYGPELLEYSDAVLDNNLTKMLGLPDQNDLVFQITCEFAAGLQYGIEKNDRRCHLLESRSDICGNNGGEIMYAGAETEQKKIVLAWLPRVSGILSLIGDIAVLIDVCRFTVKRQRIYNQLVASMALFDMLSSIGWITSTAANPTDDVWSIFGERGTEATCKSQAFLIQLGVTALLYTVSLMTYYFLTVVCGARDKRLKRAVKYMHLLPIVGIILALAGIPFYGSILVTCHVMAPPLMTDSWLPIIWLQFVPVISAIVISSILALLVLKKAYRRESGEDTNTLERQAANQAFVYMVAAYVSWVSSLVFFRNLGAASYRLSCTTLALMPLQGALNSVNYFRVHFKVSMKTGNQPGVKKNAVTKDIEEVPEEEDLSDSIEFRFDPSASLERAPVSTAPGGEQNETESPGNSQEKQ